MHRVIYNGDADLRIGTMPIPKGTPIEMADDLAEVLVRKYGAKYVGVGEPDKEDAPKKRRTEK